MKRIFFSVFILLVLFILGGVAYIKWGLPNVKAAPVLTINKSADRVQRGEYLATSVAVCMDCHSTRDWNKYSGPIMPGTLGKGGERFDDHAGFPGIIYSKNITPSHLGSWTDGEIFRAITTGVSKDGRALFPVMPYSYYSSMDPEDVYDIIAYLRTLPAIENETPDASLNFPMNFIINTIPKNATPQSRPAKSDTLLYGAYITNMAGCRECHTPERRGQIIESESFSGGREFIMPGGIVRSANITPDPQTGIGGWTEDMFVQRFKAFAQKDTVTNGTHSVNTLMPWTMYAHMDSTDLSAIYKYLISLPPVKKQVVIYN